MQLEFEDFKKGFLCNQPQRVSERVCVFVHVRAMFKGPLCARYNHMSQDHPKN